MRRRKSFKHNIIEYCIATLVPEPVCVSGMLPSRSRHTGLEPKPALSKEIKKQTGAPTSLVDRIVSREAEKALKKFRTRGKPH